ncbi:hypothetical protein [Mumia zhuanghuii]|uniref:hypothetical protein n=1 Tax=Mumia zhuanghuii TaxID=2585211 RepID=UPI00129D00F4|nr:hypothetical protein [Mumia zhuanghuii]
MRLWDDTFALEELASLAPVQLDGAEVLPLHRDVQKSSHSFRGFPVLKLRLSRLRLL